MRFVKHFNTSRTGFLIFLVLVIILAVSFILRVLPIMQMDFSSYGMLHDPDTWYNYRQIEVMVHHFPQYNWFDPMTAFPQGKNVDWGPAFPFFAALAAIVVGANPRFEMMMAASWVPVFFGIFMIPVLYYLGRMLVDWKTGLIAAIFIAFVSGEYFYRSSFGMVDHHIAEVFFTTIFSLVYLYLIKNSGRDDISVRNFPSLKPLIIPALVAGGAFGLGLLVSPTVILFLGIVGIYTVLQYCWNTYHNRVTDYLLVTNILFSLVALIFLAFNGVHSSDFSFIAYSYAQVYSLFLLILGTIFLHVLSLVFRGKPGIFLVLAGGSVAALVIAISLLNPSVSASIATLFGQANEWTTIEELKPISLGYIWSSFNIGFILAVIGLFLAIYHFWKKEVSANLYVSVWAILVIILTIWQIRWAYYSAVVISLLSAYLLGYAIRGDKRGPGVREKEEVQGKRGQKGDKKTRKKSPDRRIPDSLGGTGFSVAIGCLIIFCGVSIVYDYSLAESTRTELLPPQWVGVLEWIEEGTPDPGVSYLGPYESETWINPPSAYGVLSWWDYGHWITYIGKRSPVSNPFQDNVGPSASFFLAESEETADKIADSYGSRYIITDWKMVNTKFPAMIAWYNPALLSGYYTEAYIINTSEIPEYSGTLTLLNQPYYVTMISRLHNFDGSFTAPGRVAYIEYWPPGNDTSLPSLSLYEIQDSNVAREKFARFSAEPHGGKSATLMGFDFGSPLENVTALHHYRLVYEEAGLKPDGEYDPETMVKVFEYIPGARLSGEGTVEVDIQTNIGRTFTYRQESEGGFFTLPYATQGSLYPVKATGPYRIVSSGRTFDVSEDEIKSGLVISGI